MKTVISQLLTRFEDGKLTRRELALLAVGASAGSELAAQSPGFKTLNLDHINYVATDYRRTRDVYAGLLGMSVANDNGMNSCELQFGDARGVGVRDRTMITVRNAPAAAATAPGRIGVDHSAFKIDNWDTNTVRAELERRGLTLRLQPGGVIDTPNYMSIMVQDPDGIGVQISGIMKPAMRQMSGPSAHALA